MLSIHRLVRGVLLACCLSSLLVVSSGRVHHIPVSRQPHNELASPPLHVDALEPTSQLSVPPLAHLTSALEALELQALSHLAQRAVVHPERSARRPVERTMHVDLTAFDELINNATLNDADHTLALPAPSSRRALLAMKQHKHSKRARSSAHKDARPTAHGPTAADLVVAPGERVLSVSLTDYHSVMYTGRIELGTPGQPFDVIFDTGSSCVWVMAASDAAAAAVHALPEDDQPTTPQAEQDKPIRRPKKYVHYFHPEQSSTYHPLHQQWAIQYGVGTCAGVLSNDTLHVNGAAAPGQLFAEATEFSGNFLNKRQPMDGIVGLSFPSGACSRWPTAVQTLYAAGAIAAPQFSFFLDSAPASDSDLSGSGLHDRSMLVLGKPVPAFMDRAGRSSGTGGGGRDDTDVEVDEQREAAQPQQANNPARYELTYVPVLHARHKAPSMWFVKLERMRVSSANSDATDVLVSLCDGSLGAGELPCAALPDSGTSFLTAPAPLFAALIGAITMNRHDCLMDGEQNVFCLAGPAGLPDLTFTLGGRDFTLTARDYLLPNMQVAIQLMDFAVPGVDVLILGDMFLRRVYTLFDMQQQRIGFGDARHVPTPANPIRSRIVWLALAATLMFVACIGGNIWLQRRRSGYQELHEHEAVPLNRGGAQQAHAAYPGARNGIVHQRH